MKRIMLVFLTTFESVRSHRALPVSLGAFALAACATWNSAPLLGPNPSRFLQV